MDYEDDLVEGMIFNSGEEIHGSTVNDCHPRLQTQDDATTIVHNNTIAGAGTDGTINTITQPPSSLTKKRSMKPKKVTLNFPSGEIFILKKF